MLSGRMAPPDVSEEFRRFDVDGVQIHLEAALLTAEPPATERMIEFLIPHVGVFTLRIARPDAP